MKVALTLLLPGGQGAPVAPLARVRLQALHRLRKCIKLQRGFVPLVDGKSDIMQGYFLPMDQRG